MGYMQKNNINAVDPNTCYGCGLCTIKCPVKCISMIQDQEGFSIPLINEERCTYCGICLKNCPTTKIADGLFHIDIPNYYCSIISNKNILIKSSSGGVFGIIAKKIIEEEGYVCGCVYDSNMNPIHILSNQILDIERMYGSKYVQSRADICFLSIKNFLDENKKVLFTGTACQVSALRIFLKKDYQNLLCVEVLCHGVPSPDLFKKYVLYLNKKLSGQVTNIQFRNKEKKGWGSEHRTCVLYQKATSKEIKKYRPFLPAYFSAFFYGINLRYSCYQCKFATTKRVADLTLGDYWGSWKKYGKRFHEGISVVSINSIKGSTIFNELKGDFIFLDKLSQEEAIASNDNFLHPVIMPTQRTNFYTNLSKYQGLWKKTYLSKNNRKKVFASIYGIVVPASIRFWLQRIKKNHLK